MVKKTIIRSPRLSKQSLAELVAELDAEVFRWVGLGRKQQRKANTNAGRVFNKLKRLLSGKWLKHFREVFAPSGLSLRSAERWMDWAREADAGIDKLANFPTATDAEAVKTRAATEKAEEEVGDVARRAPKPERVFRFSISMPVSSDEEWSAAVQFWRSKHRSRVEKEMVTVFKRLQVERGFASSGEDVRRKQNEDALVEA